MGYSDFCLLRGSDYFLRFKILNFAIVFWVSRFCQLFLWVCQFEQVVIWVCHFPQVFLGYQFKNVYFVVFLVYMLSKCIKIIFMTFD